LWVEFETKTGGNGSGKEKLNNAYERAEFATFCGYRQHLNRAAVKFFAEAFIAAPKLAEDLDANYRYNAACFAACAAAGRGEDAAKLDEQRQADFRKQALQWLQADLSAWNRLLENDPKLNGRTIEQMMRHWQQDADLADVRGSEALAKLPTTEREGWRTLWVDVENLRKKASETGK
jgi:hypothetical protein